MKTSVLVVDDSRTIRTLVRQALEQVGFDVHLAEDGVEGVERFSEVKPNVVITDINMPNLDGFGVISHLREKAKTAVPILVLTTESSAELKTRARDLGATGWIVKPFEDVALINVLRRVTGYV